MTRDDSRPFDNPASSHIPLSWSHLYRHRRAAAARFGRIEQLPIVRRVREVLSEVARSGEQVLEVGAGDRQMQAMFEQYGPSIVYRSFDIDPQGQHDYGAIDEIDCTFDGLFACEVIEHLPIEQIPAWLATLYELIRPGGWLLLSTPNTYYPPAYLRDATHRTPLCYDELAGLVAATGFQVTRLVRIYHDPLPRKLLRRYLLGWLFQALGLDYARQIVLVARKPVLAPNGDSNYQRS